jgi:hypothetical protein
MARILVKTTSPFVEDDWHIGRFSLLLLTLEKDGHQVTGRDRTPGPHPDADLLDAANGIYEQVWLIGMDATDALSRADIEAIERFRETGGGLLLSRDHQDLGSSFARIAKVGQCQNFQRVNPESERARQLVDDTASPHITWPNYHSGRNGDAQPIEIMLPSHPLMRRSDGACIRTLPAHPHEGALSVPPSLAEVAHVVATGRSLTTGVIFNLVIAIETGEPSGTGRVVANSTFHHFCDCNWEPSLGAPTFVSEPWGDGMVRDPRARKDVEDFVRNIATWLQPPH